MTIERGVPNLTGLFSLQNVTPIHVAPAVWLGLHWKGLRGEAVVAGMLSGRQLVANCGQVSCVLRLLTQGTVPYCAEH
jgi:Na+/proline symporter